MKTPLLIYGLQRSGTNFLQHTLDQHFALRWLNEPERHSPRHKHFRLYENKELIARPPFRNDCHFQDFPDFSRQVLAPEAPRAVLVLSKDPYSWYRSYRRWAWKNRWRKSPHHPIREYVAFYQRWLNFARESEQVVLLRYIDLLNKPEAVLENLERDLGLERRTQQEAALPEKVAMSRRFDPKKRLYYQEERYLQQYTSRQLRKLNAALPQSLLEGLGYARRD